ncbi:MAG: exodeoxyribonuclease VII small subunit [Caldilineales bacterium]|nr:exodeoxyribonuclease VII small subunit [Caldilineales bacterium]MDW8316526.1 exodeoxyribonuclease VII small subunit [Anaerolineae bacterium]
MEDSITFEQALKELEAAVQALEAGDLPLEEALKQFERGMRLAELADRQLSQAELRVRQLLADPAGGLKAEPFDAWEGDNAQ